MSKVRVVNSVWNGTGMIKRKVAEFYVAEGRGEWLSGDQLRLIISHPKNQAALARAKAWQDGYRPQLSDRRDRLNHAVALYPDRLAGLDHQVTRFAAPPAKAPAFSADYKSERLVVRDHMICRPDPAEQRSQPQQSKKKLENKQTKNPREQVQGSDIVEELDVDMALA